MNLLRHNIKPPTSPDLKLANIDRMLDGEPFWSEAPRDFGAVLSKKFFKGRLREYLRYDYRRHYNFDGSDLSAIAAIRSLVPTTESVQLVAGRYNVRNLGRIALPHIDSLEGKYTYRETFCRALLGYPTSTWCFEGPMQMTGAEKDTPPGTLTAFNYAKRVVNGEVTDTTDVMFRPLDEQQPAQVVAGHVALLLESTVHFAPEPNNEPRYFIIRER